MIKRMLVAGLASLALLGGLLGTGPVASAQAVASWDDAVCSSGEYCFWSGANFRDSIYTTPDANWAYSGRMRTTNWLPVGAWRNDSASSWWNRGYMVSRSYREHHGGGGLLWAALPGSSNGWVGTAFNDQASSHYWTRY